VAGAFGGNFSQELSNVNSLYKESDKKITLLGEENAAFLLRPETKHFIHCRVGPKVCTQFAMILLKVKFF
jgi:thiamine pyrophosphokinase